MKILKKILSVFLHFSFFILAAIFITLTLLKMTFKTENIIDNLKTIDYSETNNSTLAYIDPDDLDDITSSIDEINSNINEEDLIKISEELEDILDKNNIPLEVIDYVDTDKFDDEITNDLLESFVNYINGTTKDLEIPKDTFENIINDAIDEYESNTGEKVDNSKVSTVINDIETLINDELDEYVENDEINIIRTILSKSLYITLIVLLIGNIILLLIVNNYNLNIFRDLGIMLVFIIIPFNLVGRLLGNAIQEESEVKLIGSNMLENVQTITYVTAIVIVIFTLLPYILKKLREEKITDEENSADNTSNRISG